MLIDSGCFEFFSYISRVLRIVKRGFLVLRGLFIWILEDLVRFVIGVVLNKWSV